jgi:hypothetical protein
MHGMLTFTLSSDTRPTRGMALHSSTCAPARAYRGKLGLQRAIATIPLRAEVKFDTCAQLSKAGS